MTYEQRSVDGSPGMADVVVIGPPRLTPPPPPPPTRGLHGVAISGMALAALAGIGAMFASIAISWPGDARKYPIAVFVFAGVAFMAFAAIAVFSAARDSYATHEPTEPPD